MASLFVEPADVLNRFCSERGSRSGRTLGRAPLSPEGIEDVDLECAAFIIRRHCDIGEERLALVLIDALFRAVSLDRLGDYAITIARLEDAPKPRDEEWLATFRSYSTDLPEGAATFELTPSIGYPRREGGRTVVRVELPVPAAEVAAIDLEGRRSYDFSLTGEVMRGGELFESFATASTPPRPVRTAPWR